MTASKLPPPLGRFIGSNIEVDALAAEGATCWLYAARHIALDIPIALKILKGDLPDAHAADRFLAEARLTARIHSSNVVHISDFGRLDDGRLYCALSFLGGGTLDQAIEFEVPEVPVALRWIRMAARGLQSIHDAGFVHRDVKPENLMLSHALDGRVVVVDLGIATPIGEVPETLAGTPVYMAPEQFESIALDPRADVYSLGATAFELLTGLRYIDASEIAEITAWHADPRPPPFPPLLHIPAAIQRVVRRALETDRDRRFVTMMDFDRALCRAALDAGLDVHLSTSWSKASEGTIDFSRVAADARTRGWRVGVPHVLAVLLPLALATSLGAAFLDSGAGDAAALAIPPTPTTFFLSMPSLEVIGHRPKTTALVPPSEFRQAAAERGIDRGPAPATPSSTADVPDPRESLRQQARQKRLRMLRHLLEQGEALTRRGQRDGATNMYHRVLAEFPRSSEARARLAELAFNRGEFAEAARWARTAVAHSPRSASYRILLGDCLLRSGQRELAKPHYGKAATLGSDLGRQRLEMAASYAR